MNVHVLNHGLPLCGFTREVPAEWPEGSKWVGLEDAQGKYRDDVTCPGCREKVRAATNRETAFRAGHLNMADLHLDLDVDCPTHGIEMRRCGCDNVPNEKVGRYRHARLACELVRNLLQQHDFSQLLRDIESADAIGPMVDPSLWMKKGKAMDEDREVFRAALRFLGAWPKEGT